MTRYTVVWRRSAQADLANAWINASDRDMVTMAAAKIDFELSWDPERKAIEVAEGLQAFYVPPLRVLLTINIDDRMVEIVRAGVR